METSRKIRDLLDEHLPSGTWVTDKEQTMRLINGMLEGLEKGMSKDNEKEKKI
jgi:hypothetical protein